MTLGASWTILVALLAEASHGAFEVAIPSATEVAMGGGSVAWALEGGAKQGNPALVGAQTGWECGAGASHPYGMSDLDLGGVWAGRGPSGWLPGWMARWKGLRAGDIYREDVLELDFAKGDKNWILGGGWRSGRASFEGLAPDWSHGFALGASLRPHPRLVVGASWQDLSGIAVPEDRWAQPWELRFGLAAVATDSAWTSIANLRKRQSEPVGWSFGQELRLGILRLRAGLGLEPWILSMGVGLRWEGLGLDWAQEGDPRLGWQQHWTISVAR